jgi:hypothetical protein
MGAAGQLEMRKSRGGKTDNLRLFKSSKSSGVHKQGERQKMPSDDQQELSTSRCDLGS